MASWLRVIAAALIAAPLLASTQPADLSRHLLIVVDGLRPDYVTTDVMPHLSALGRRGVIFNHHHAVYPTVTRINAASFSTGTYAERHGLMGNSVFFPSVDPAKFLDTADRFALQRIAAVEGTLLTAPTLGETLQAAGRRMLVVSSASAGSALLNNHTVSGGAILHPQFTLPEKLGEAMKALGPVPRAGTSPGALDRYAVDAFLKVGLSLDPSVTVLWLGELDATAHLRGVGAPDTVAVLRHADAAIRQVEDGLRAAGVFDRYNIWVTSDHGFSTYTGAPDVNAALQPFMRAMPDGSPRIVSGSGAIYVRDRDPSTIAGIVAALQRLSGVGAIFTPSPAAGSLTGGAPGTLSFEAARWTHDRSAQILYSPDWTGTANGHGFRGTSASSGVAGHGSSSPWDIHNTLIAAGPDLKRGFTVDAPSGNVDFAPTFMSLLQLKAPATVQGRVLSEALLRGPANAGAVRTQDIVSRSDAGRYAVTGTFSTVTAGGRDYRYLDSTQVARK